MVELYVLLVAMLVAAVVSVEIRDLLAAAVGMGIVGFSVAIMFILLQAPDLAIVQIVVETLTVVFFAAVILRTTHTDTTLAQRPRSRLRLSPDSTSTSTFPLVVFAAFAVLFLILSAHVLRELPPFGSPTMFVAREYLAQGMERTGAANVVAAIILDYRGYDTLGEGTVLFTAVVGVLTIVRRAGRKER
jgi:multisubunit Na+/H+ antiporter MnhB subunit